MTTPHAHLFSSESFGPLIHFELVLYIMWSRIQLYSFECEYLVVPALFIEKTPLSPLNGPGTLIENHLTLGTWLNNKQQKYGFTPGLWAQLHHLCLYVDCAALLWLLRFIGFESFQIRNVCVWPLTLHFFHLQDWFGCSGSL